MATKKNLKEIMDEATAAADAPEVEVTEGNDEEKKSRKAKMTRDYSDGDVFKVTVAGGNKGEMIFRASEYPESIQKKFPSFALNHRLGDATSGVRGVEAEEAIIKTHEAMMKGEWDVKIAKGPSIKASDVKAGFDALDDSLKSQALELLKSLGLTIPGVTG